MDGTPGAPQVTRVVLLFGPHLRSAHEFAVRLAADERIELVGLYCEAPGEGWRERLTDLLRRRGPLGLPIYAAGVLLRGLEFVRHPSARIRHHRAWSRLARQVRYVEDLHSPAVIREIQATAPDVGAVYGGPILRPELFEVPSRGTLGIHHGRLPAYRGKKTTFWEIWEGEERAGVTIQRINAGVDTGTIVSTGTVPVGRRPYERVWKDVQALGIDLFVEALATGGVPESRPMAGADFAGGGTPDPIGPLRYDPGWRELLALPFRRWTRRLRDRRARIGR